MTERTVEGKFTVQAVSDQTREWSSEKGGPMISYRMSLANEAGGVAQNVEWARKRDSPAPTIGQELEGAVTFGGEYGPKFKAAQRGGGGGGYRPRDPAERRAIERQHSQEMALRFLLLHHPQGTQPPAIAHVFEVADQFDADIKQSVDAMKRPG